MRSRRRRGCGTEARRSYASQNTVYLNRQAANQTAAHEMGHVFEHANRHMFERAVEYLELHWVPDAAPESLKVLTGFNYLKDEKAIRGSFFNPYVGKVYGTRGKLYATEVLSMGLEELFVSPLGLYTKDPDLFDFMVALLGGWI